MSLNDLALTLQKRSLDVKREGNIRKDMACGIIDDLFGEIKDCIDHDRSTVKLNLFEKSFISGLLGDRTKNGIKKYINNMSDVDVTNLLNKINRRFGMMMRK